MKEWIKKHKKTFGAFIIAILGALVTLITNLTSSCTSTGSWSADFKKYPEPSYHYERPTQDTN